MFHSFAIVYSIIFMCFSTFSHKIRLSQKQFTVLWCIFVLSLSIMAYNLSPPIGWDINSHLMYMNQIRSSEITFLEFLFNNSRYIGGYEYANLITFNIIRYIVVHISENDYLLPAICVFIDYSILGYIVKDWLLENNKGYNLDLCTLLLSFTFMPYVHTASGMRNALSSSIVSLAIYLYLYKKKNIALLIVLTFMAITVHPFALITIPFIFLAKLNMGYLQFIAVFIISVLLTPMAQLMANSQVFFLAIIGRKYIAYTSGTQYIGSRAPLYGVLIITAFFLLIYFLYYKRFNIVTDNSNKKTIYNFIAIYMVYIWGNIGDYDMVLRPGYVLGTFAPILSFFLSDKMIWSGLKAKAGQIVNKSIIFTITALCIYVNYKFFIESGKYF